MLYHTELCFSAAAWFGFVWFGWLTGSSVCVLDSIRLNDTDVEGLCVCVCFVLPAGRYGDPHIYFQVGTCCRQSFAISAFRMFYLPIKFEPSSFILTESQRHWMLYINTADHNVEFWDTHVPWYSIPSTLDHCIYKRSVNSHLYFI